MLFGERVEYSYTPTLISWTKVWPARSPVRSFIWKLLGRNILLLNCFQYKINISSWASSIKKSLMLEKVHAHRPK